MRYLLLIALAGLMAVSCGDNNSTGQQDAGKVPVPLTGEQIFNNNCIQCHALHEDRIGPKLAGVMDRWHNDTTGISAFIRDAGTSIASGHPRAVQVAEEWHHSVMTPMPHLSDNDIRLLLDYISQ